MAARGPSIDAEPPPLPGKEGGAWMETSNVIDFFAARRRRRMRMARQSLREHALNKCVEMYERCDWRGFAYWHAVFVRERRREELTSG